MKNKKTIFCLAIACVVLVLVLTIDIGMTKNRIEKDADKDRDVFTTYVEKEISKDIAAFLFYDKERKIHDTRIYVNYPGLSFGYFFKYGGNSPEVENGVGLFEMDKIPAVAYVSMNKPEVSHMIVGSGDAEELIVIDSDKPFAVVVEKELGMVRIFDKNDELVEPIVM